MDKEWCTYGSYSANQPNYVGKIAKDLGSTVYIIASENQGISDLWDGDYVRRFENLDEAIDFYLENRPGIGIVEGTRHKSEKQFREHMQICYPTYYKEKE